MRVQRPDFVQETGLQNEILLDGRRLWPPRLGAVTESVTLVLFYVRMRTGMVCPVCSGRETGELSEYIGEILAGREAAFKCDVGY